MNRRLFSVLGGAVLLTVCSRGDDSTARAAPATTASTAEEIQAGGTISGKIKFTGARPTNPRIDMSEEVACKNKYPAPPTAETVVVNPNGTLANVFVYVKAGLPAGATYPAPATAVVLDQSGCRYHPHVLGVMVGQNLEILNSDPVLHNIKAKAVKNRPFNVSQPSAGMKTMRTFATPEVMVALECNVHGWMNAFLGVLPHPFYAVSGADGSFSIKGLPPGTYTIEAWHEKYGTQTATVTVAGAAPKTQDFTFAAH
jgi:plastocyanin